MTIVLVVVVVMNEADDDYASSSSVCITSTTALTVYFIILICICQLAGWRQDIPLRWNDRRRVLLPGFRVLRRLRLSLPLATSICPPPPFPRIDRSFIDLSFSLFHSPSLPYRSTYSPRRCRTKGLAQQFSPSRKVFTTVIVVVAFVVFDRLYHFAAAAAAVPCLFVGTTLSNCVCVCALFRYFFTTFLLEVFWPINLCLSKFSLPASLSLLCSCLVRSSK